MDCGVRVDAGKPLIIAEDRSKTLTKMPPAVPKRVIQGIAVALACRQMAAAVATFKDSSPPGWAMRTFYKARAIKAPLTPCPSWPNTQAQLDFRVPRCNHS